MLSPFTQRRVIRRGFSKLLPPEIFMVNRFKGQVAEGIPLLMGVLYLKTPIFKVQLPLCLFKVCGYHHLNQFV